MGTYLVDWGKLATIAMLIASTTILAALHVVPAELASYILVATAGYTFGNGRLAAKGKPPGPMLYKLPAVLVDEDLVDDDLEEGP